ncbi:MAG: tetrapyrrole methylase [Deltaproteobacteria bacterium]|nr:tetrapyrrole methylase [Deltaproteobacteria bacterium]MBW2135330.1 tetrapyrrole methylase [Deltaproteobacteria bacterium]
MVGIKLAKPIWITALLMVGGMLAVLPAVAGSGTLYLVSTGPGDPQHLTVKALETIKNADLVLCSHQSAKNLREILKGKKVEDPWKELWFYQGVPWMKDLATFKPEARAKIVAEKKRQRDEYVKRLQILLDQGKKVALLEGGDPTVYSRSFWILDELDEGRVEIIPGVGAMTAAMAALKKSSTGGGARFVAQTAPFAFFGKSDRDDLARDLSRYPGTLVFYMGIAEIENLVNTLKKYNSADLPLAVVFYAGYAEKEKVIKGNLGNILGKVAPEKEDWLGMIIVGHCLEGPAFNLSGKAKKPAIRKGPSQMK